jgi:hypothetical protein
VGFFIVWARWYVNPSPYFRLRQKMGRIYIKIKAELEPALKWDKEDIFATDLHTSNFVKYIFSITCLLKIYSI